VPTHSQKNPSPFLPAERFELPIHIQPSDIDELGHVNNVVFLRWVQDAAVAHWRATAPAADQAVLVWVVVRHEIDYKRPAQPDDEIVAVTWVGTAKRRAFDRHTELLRASDRKLLARARTVWCPIAVATGKPTDVSAEVRRRFSVPDPAADDAEEPSDRSSRSAGR
jgi:acyl-CoA thioester hydrolase